MNIRFHTNKRTAAIAMMVGGSLLLSPLLWADTGSEVTLPYEQKFNREADASGFTIVDANNDGSTWAMARVSDQMAAAQAKHSNPDDPDNYIENYNAVLGVNADFYNMSTGTPSGALVMEGVEYHGVGSENFFANSQSLSSWAGTAMMAPVP